MKAALYAVRDWLKRILGGFNRHLGPAMAGAVAYFALLSVVPTLSLAISVLGWVLGSAQALQEVENSIAQYLPSNSDVIHEMLTSVKRDRGVTGLIGLGGLLLSGAAVFGNIGVAFNQIWGVKRTRAWWKRRLIAIACATITISLLGASIAATSALAWVSKFNLTSGTLLSDAGVVLGNVLTVGVSSFMFAVLYRMLPNAHVGWRAALTGGLFAGIAWEVAKHGFRIYLDHFGNYNKLYGSLGSLVILVVWTYYSATVMLLGAEIAADAGGNAEGAEQTAAPDESGGPSPDEHSPDRDPGEDARAPSAGRGPA